MLFPFPLIYLGDRGDSTLEESLDEDQPLDERSSTKGGGGDDSRSDAQTDLDSDQDSDSDDQKPKVSLGAFCLGDKGAKQSGLWS